MFFSRPIKKLFWLFLLLASSLSVADISQGLSPVAIAAANGADKFLKGPAPEWVVTVDAPAAPASPEPNTLRLGDTQMRWDAAGETAYVRRVIQANNGSGLQSIGQLTIEFNPAYQICTLHSLRILRGNNVIDKLNSVSPRFLERELGLEQSIYTGAVTVALLVDDVRVGDTVDFAFSLNGANPVFNGAITESAAWESEAPVISRRVTLQFPSDRPVAYRFIGANSAARSIKPRETVKSGLRELVFEQQNIEPIHAEGFYPPGYQPATWIQISEYKDWNQVARWAEKLFQTPSPSSAEYQQQVEKLKAIADPSARVAAALQFAQAEIRYTSISFGQNSHLPASPDVVLQRRYGDCKDKSLLLVSLLQAVGLNAKPVILSMGLQKGLNDQLPSTDAFDHAIVKLDLRGKTYWLDPTAQQGPKNLETLGKLHGDFDVLVVDRKTEKLTRIEDFKPETFSVRERVHLDTLDGPASLTKTTTATGATAEVIRKYFAETSPIEIKKAMLNEVQYVYVEPEWIGEPVIINNAEANTFTYTGNFRLQKYTEQFSDGWLMRHKPVYISEFFAIPEAARRHAPYALRYPVKAAYTHEVELPDNVSADVSNEEKNIADAFFSLRQVQRRQGRLASVEYNFSTLATSVSPENMGRYIDDIRRVQNEIRTSIFLERRYVATSLSEIDKYRLAAEKGDLEAQVQLGLMYAKGDGVPQDNQLAQQWWQKAAAKGSAKAQFNMGLLYFDGSLGVKQDSTQAALWLRKAANQNLASAQYFLAQLLWRGEGVAQNKNEAMQLLRKAADQGEDRAQYMLGYNYLVGQGVSKDIDLAVVWWRKSAEQNNVDAMNALGLCYEDGSGVTRDQKQAIELFRKAAELGGTRAQNNLGRIYYRGSGVAQNFDEALKFWSKAAEQGDAEARFQLGVLHANNRYSKYDYREALKWWLRAGTKIPVALNNIGVLSENGDGVPKDFTQALTWYRASAEIGCVKALANLGILYSRDDVPFRDLVEAYKWFILADNAGDEDGKNERTKLTAKLSSADLAEAQRRAQAWKPSQRLDAVDVRFIEGPQPEYPASARRLGEEGKVYVEFVTDHRGLVASVELARSSGFEDLDNAALAAAKRYTFSAARLGDTSVYGLKVMAIAFKLDKSSAGAE